MSYFITGTDTGVGKTLISCALLRAFAAQGKRVVGMKPVAAGLDEHGRHEDVLALRAASSFQATSGQINPYSFHPAAAPHLAARHVGVRVDFSRILTSYEELAGQADLVIVEGAGGFRVPLNDTQDIRDLARKLRLPVILVVGMRLGCINHALLTADSIVASGLQCAGWVANCITPEMAFLQENIATLQQRIAAPLLGVVPYQPQTEASLTLQYLDLKWLATKPAASGG